MTGPQSLEVRVEPADSDADRRGLPQYGHVARERSQPGRVIELSRGDESRWDEFVRASRDGTFYHLAGWRDIFENELHHRTHYLVYENDGVPEAILPLVHVNSRLFGNSLISLGFLVYGGPIASTPEAAVEVVSRATDLAHELGVDRLELRNRVPLDEEVHGTEWKTGSSYVTFRKAIDADPETNMKAIPRKQRAMIRKGIQGGLSSEIDDDATRLYRAMLECKRNLGTPFFGRRYLQAIKDRFGDDAQILTVVRGQDTICSVMSFRYQGEILPYYGGGGVLARKYAGNDYMYWCVMEKACREGARVFDYGRSMAGTGAYNFKRYWGFEPQPLAYQYHLVRSAELPNSNPANPKYRVAIDAWKRLPLPLAGVVGPFIARQLG